MVVERRTENKGKTRRPLYSGFLPMLIFVVSRKISKYAAEVNVVLGVGAGNETKYVKTGGRLIKHIQLWRCLTKSWTRQYSAAKSDGRA